MCVVCAVILAVGFCMRLGHTDALLAGLESLGLLGLLGPAVIGILWVFAKWAEADSSPTALQPGQDRPPGPSYLTDYPYVSLSRAAVARIYRTLAQFAHCGGRVDPGDRALLRNFRSRFQVAPQLAARVELEARHEREPEIGVTDPERQLLHTLLEGLVASRRDLSLGEGMFMARYRRARRRAWPEIELRPRRRGRPELELRAHRSREPHATGRCACCHDVLTGEIQSCHGCGTWVHPACLGELSVGGACPTPGCGGRGWSRAEHVLPTLPPLPPLPGRLDPLPALSPPEAVGAERVGDDSLAWLLDRPELLERVWSEGSFQRLLAPAGSSGRAQCRCADCHALGHESFSPGTRRVRVRQLS